MVYLTYVKAKELLSNVTCIMIYLNVKAKENMHHDLLYLIQG